MSGQPPPRAQFAALQQPRQIVGGDVQHLVMLGQGGGHVGGRDAQKPRRLGGARGLDMRIGLARQGVVEDARADQQRRIGHGGEQREQRIARGGQHDQQRHRAARRMQAAQAEHGGDGHADGGAGGEDRIGDQVAGQQPGDGGNRIAADHRPRLRQRRGRHGEHQHGAGPHRRDQPRRQMRGLRRRQADQGCDRDAEAAAQRRAQPFEAADGLRARQSGAQTADGVQGQGGGESGHEDTGCTGDTSLMPKSGRHFSDIHEASRKTPGRSRWRTARRQACNRLRP